MVNKVLVKETFNFIKKNFKMYFSQIIIILLGVGFFVGMRVSVVDLHKIMSCFIEEHCLYDYKVSVDCGIEQKDIEELKSKIPNLKYVEGASSEEVVTNIDNVNSVVKIHSYNKNNHINTLKVISGKLPEKENDCVIDTKLEKHGYKVGDQITVHSDNLNVEILNITGIVQSPNYLTYDRGNSNALSGKINYYIYVLEENINSDVFSEVYLKYNVKYKPFSKSYNRFLKEQYNNVNDVFLEYYNTKFKDLINKEQEKVDEAKKEYDSKKLEIDSKLSSYEKEIRDKEEKIKDAEGKILTEEEIEKKINEELNSSQVDQSQLNTELPDNVSNEQKSEIKEMIKEYNSSIELEKLKIKSYNEEIQKENQEIDELENGYTVGIIEHEGIKQLEEELRQLESESSLRKVKIDILKKKIQSKKDEVLEHQNNITELNNKIAQSNNIIEDYTNKINTLSSGKTVTDKEENNNSITLDKTSLHDKYYEYYMGQKKTEEEKIKVYKEELNEAKKVYATNKESAYEELKDSEIKIEDAQNKIDSLSNPQNYIFTRNDNSSYSQFVDDTTTILNLGKIVPILFYIISFIMIASSISKIMFVERNQIGTLKALGFKTSEIRLKYLIYSGTMVSIGSILGIIVGIFILPLAIYKLYHTLYEFPYFKFAIDLKYVLLAVMIAFGVALISTLISCHNTLVEKPIALLKTKVEKFAKRGLLEKIGFVWNRLRFSTRIALKNVFKYKIRVIMTVLGIGGCLSLMLIGFSLRTSIGEMIPTQYGKVFKLQAQIFFKNEATRSEISNSIEKISDLKNVKKTISSNFLTMSTKNDSKSIDVNVITIDDKTDYHDFIAFRDVKTKQNLKLSDDGVIISQKLAVLLETSVNDTIILYDSNQKEYKIKVVGIVENYMDHYIYFNDNYYYRIFGSSPKKNMLLVKTIGKYDELELAEKMSSSGMVSKISFTSIAKKYYSDIMSILSILVAIFIVFSILLIFAVLYNLININVLERNRELATYKVLGFEEKTISSILKKENNILMFIGIVLGVILGRRLASIVIEVCEIENFNFIKSISDKNCVISVLLTIIFTTMCNKVIDMYIKRINMTESLKKNE